MSAMGRKVWSRLGWAALALLLVLGAWFGLTQWRAQRDLNAFQEQRQQNTTAQESFRQLCARQLQQQTGLTGQLDPSATSSDYQTTNQGGGVTAWSLFGTLNTAQGQRPFQCDGQEQGGQFTVQRVSFTVSPENKPEK